MEDKFLKGDDTFLKGDFTDSDTLFIGDDMASVAPLTYVRVRKAEGKLLFLFKDDGCAFYCSPCRTVFFRKAAKA